MTERDVLFLVMILITTTTLVVFVWRFLQARRRPPERPWWAGPEDAPDADTPQDDPRRDEDR